MFHLQKSPTAIHFVLNLGWSILINFGAKILPHLSVSDCIETFLWLGSSLTSIHFVSQLAYLKNLGKHSPQHPIYRAIFFKCRKLYLTFLDCRDVWPSRSEKSHLVLHFLEWQCGTTRVSRASPLLLSKVFRLHLSQTYRSGQDKSFLEKV